MALITPLGFSFTTRLKLPVDPPLVDPLLLEAELEVPEALAEVLRLETVDPVDEVEVLEPVEAVDPLVEPVVVVDPGLVDDEVATEPLELLAAVLAVEEGLVFPEHAEATATMAARYTTRFMGDLSAGGGRPR